MENQFIGLYAEQLDFHGSFTRASPQEFASQKGVRLDRVLVCEVRAGLAGKTLAIQYSSATRGDPLNQLKVEHRFEVLPQGQPRVTWIHVADELPVYSQNQIQVCVGDLVHLPLNLSNVGGLADLDAFRFRPPLLSKTDAANALTYNRDLPRLIVNDRGKSKVYCDINRVCEIEDATVEWLPMTPIHRPQLEIPTHKFSLRFKILSVHFNELD